MGHEVMSECMRPGQIDAVMAGQGSRASDRRYYANIGLRG
jgi:hypothetical protein